MSKRKIILWSAAAVTAGLALALPYNPAEAQRKRPTAERKLLGVSLGSPMLRVMQMYQQSSEVQTVALATTPDSLPSLGGGMGGGMSGPGMEGMGGMGGMGGGYPGMGGAMGAGGPGGPPPGMGGMAGMMGGGMAGPRMGGMAGAGGGVPSLPGPGGAYGGYPGGGGGPAGMGGMGAMAGGPGMGGMMGGMGGMGGMGPGMGMGAEGGTGMPGGGANMPEYSNALLLIYKDRPIKSGRSEFLVNEDGQVAQISLAAPAGKTYGGPGGRTARGIGLGSSFQQVVDAYGYPERHRLLPGFRFYEAYYSKNYHAAFTFDTQKGMKVVRITIALAD